MVHSDQIQKNYEYGLTDVKFAGFDVEVDGVYQPYINETVHFDCLQLPQVELLYKGIVVEYEAVPYEEDPYTLPE